MQFPKAYVLDRYTEEDFEHVLPNVMEAAVKFIDLIRSIIGSEESEYVKIVPRRHLSERDANSPKCVGIIHEGHSSTVEAILYGLKPDASRECDKLVEQYLVIFEPYNHWALSVWDDK